MSAGSRKMPPPIVMLTMPAARERVPIERRSAESGEDVWVVAVTVIGR